MKANAASLLEIFDRKMRLEVPLFQRQYVWKREQQWEPLWEDIARKFTEYLEGSLDAPVHFLGAIVLDQKQTPTVHVDKRQIIDGQQRLSTFQIFLSAFRDFCREHNCDEVARECDRVTINTGMMADAVVDRYKVWPTQLDRAQFMDVVSSGARLELERRHPLVRAPRARKPFPRPPMVEAYLFFYEQLTGFFVGTPEDPPLASSSSLELRLEDSLRALKNALQVVVIDLEHGDDPQVIFETLNARGEPLLPADLLRNYIFLRAARQNEPQEELYYEFWQRFDDKFWRVEVKQGRLNRPRSDLFMQHFLASRQGRDIPIKNLFVEYKFWVERERPFENVRDELATLARQGDDFRRILEPKVGDPLNNLVTFLDAFDIRTIYPLLLALLDTNIKESDLLELGILLESYLLRRAICGLTAKNLNRIFLNLTRNLRRDGITRANLVKLLSEQAGESSEWPSDAAFREAWTTHHAYHLLNNPKLVYVFKRLNATYMTSKSEEITFSGQLTIEHIMPQQWLDHWPLADGTNGLSYLELETIDNDASRAIATRHRIMSLQTIGNLTIVTQPLNSSVSNGSWANKKSELLKHSLLPINQQLYNAEVWDEGAILQRSIDLYNRALLLWPRI